MWSSKAKMHDIQTHFNLTFLCIAEKAACKRELHANKGLIFSWWVIPIFYKLQLQMTMCWISNLTTYLKSHCNEYHSSHYCFQFLKAQIDACLMQKLYSHHKMREVTCKRRFLFDRFDEDSDDNHNCDNHTLNFSLVRHMQVMR